MFVFKKADTVICIPVLKGKGAKLNHNDRFTISFPFLFVAGKSAGNILALTTSGLKMSPATYIKYPAVDAEDIELEVDARKLSSSSDHSAKEAAKTHKKTHSLGYFKRPGFLATKEHIELEPIPGPSESSSEVPRPCSSEINVPSDTPDGVELLATSYSAEEILDHKF